MPAYVAWKPSLTVFVDEIDYQHKQLFTRMNAFLESVVRGDGQREVERTLKFLIDYCVVHFGTEERHMRKHNYPGYSTHRKAHEELTAGVLEMQGQIEQGGLTRQHIITLVNQLGDWVTEHIEKMDKAMGAYLGSMLGKTQSMTAPPQPSTPTRDGPRPTPSREAVTGSEGTCPHASLCEVMFERFRDPESSPFWKNRYCQTRGGTDCRRKQMMDDGADPAHVPATMLPDGQHL